MFQKLPETVNIYEKVMNWIAYKIALQIDVETKNQILFMLKTFKINKW